MSLVLAAKSLTIAAIAIFFLRVSA
jgi:hypothetical protein